MVAANVVASNLPLLSGIWNWPIGGPWFFTFVFAFVGVNVFILYEGNFGRKRYLSFIINEAVLIPSLVTFGLAKMHHVGSVFLMPLWWQWICLIAGWSLSLWLERGAHRSGLFTVRQELSPSKLWHTFAFGILVYWLAAPLWVFWRYFDTGSFLYTFVGLPAVGLIGLRVQTQLIGHRLPTKAENEDQSKDAVQEWVWVLPWIWQSHLASRPPRHGPLQLLRWIGLLIWRTLRWLGRTIRFLVTGRR